MRSIKLLLLFTCLVLFSFGCTPAYKVDSQSGILIKSDKPDRTVETFYALQEAGSFEQAYELLNEESKEIFSANDLKYFWESTTENSHLEKTLSVNMKGDFAAVTYVRMLDMSGKQTALAGSEILIKKSGKWLILRNPDQFSDRQLLEIFKLLVKAEDNALGLQIEGFSAEDTKSIKDQLYNFKSKHMDYVSTLKDRIENPEKYKEKEESVSKGIYAGEDDLENNHY